MTKPTNRTWCLWATAITLTLSALSALPGLSQTVDVTARVQLEHRSSHASSRRDASAGVAVWLVPAEKNPPSAPPRPKQTYTLVQKDKKFTPHLLVVPVGSSVDFPNLDPFFHNVFSLYNGKRFDLGLYPAHTRRSVVFDREGVSYIFCNIHPEMGAVIIALKTPYYGVSRSDGTLVIHQVPPGSYRMYVWAEDVDTSHLNALSRAVEITEQNSQLGLLHLTTTDDVMEHHKNKFGEDYPPPITNTY